MDKNASRSSLHPLPLRNQRRAILVTGVVWLAAGTVVATLGWILIDIASRGLSHVSMAFLTGAVEDAGRSGGIGPILISTLLLLGVTLFTAVPLALATAIDLTERIDDDARFLRIVRCCLDVLAGVPSIVFGLFGNALFVITLGLGYSILAGGFTLACMVLPLLIRTFEQAIIAVPREQRFAAAALGLNRTATLFRVILPAAAPGLIAGLVLAVGRALAETAALIFTAGYVARTPASLFDSGRSMSVHIYDLAMNVPNGGTQAYATACVLVVSLLAINGMTVFLLRWAGLEHHTANGGQW